MMLTANLPPADDIVPRAQVALSNSPITELRELRVEESHSGLMLSGSVSSFYHKQLAQEVVWAVCKDVGVDLLNQVEVNKANKFFES
jgi:hypothetical protein